MVYPIGKIFFSFLTNIWVKDIKGISNIPKEDSFIFCANHSSFLDDFILPTVITKACDRYFHIYVNSRFYRSFFLKLLLDHYGCLPVYVEKHNYSKEKNQEAFNTALKYLNKGDNVGIFPEGRRSKDGRLQKAKPGAARLALAARKPVLPVGIIGSYNLYPKGKKIPQFRKNITFNIGKPLYFEDLYGKEKDFKSLDKVTDIIMKEIASLAAQQYNP